jgi:hypothetical protein
MLVWHPPNEGVVKRIEAIIKRSVRIGERAYDAI